MVRKQIPLTYGWILPVFLLAGCGPGKIDLQLQPKIGETRNVAYVEKTFTTITYQGRKLVITADESYGFDVTVTGTDTNGTLLLECTFTDVKIAIDSNLGTITAASSSADNNIVIAVLESAVGESFSAGMEPNGTVRYVQVGDLTDRLMSKASVTNPAVQALIRDSIGEVMSQYALRQMLGRVFNVYGDTSATVGDTWTERGDFGPRGATLAGDSTLSVSTRENGVATIAQSITMAQSSLGTYSILPGVEVSVQASGSGFGTCVIDETTTWPRKYESSVKLTGSATLSAADLGSDPSAQMEIDQTTNITVR